MKHYYVIKRLSEIARKRSKAILLFSGIPAAALLVLDYFQLVKVFDNGLTGGMYLIIASIALYAFGLIVKDDTAQIGESKTPQNQRYYQDLTQPHGAVSSAMLLLDWAPPIMFLAGVVFVINFIWIALVS